METNPLSRESLEQVVNQFALGILKHHGIHCKVTDFKFMLEENMTNSAMIRAGNPVLIHIRVHDLAEALVKKGAALAHFKRLIESCLTVVPRMLHTLSLVPVGDIIKWDTEMKKFKVHKGKDIDLLPKLLPDEQIHYTVRLQIIATHIPTDTTVKVFDTRLDIDKLKRIARETLSEEVFAPNAEP